MLGFLEKDRYRGTVLRLVDSRRWSAVVGESVTGIASGTTSGPIGPAFKDNNIWNHERQ